MRIMHIAMFQDESRADVCYVTLLTIGKLHAKKYFFFFFNLTKVPT